MKRYDLPSAVEMKRRTEEIIVDKIMAQITASSDMGCYNLAINPNQTQIPEWLIKDLQTRGFAVDYKAIGENSYHVMISWSAE